MSAHPTDGGPAFPQAPQEYEAIDSSMPGLTTITSTSDAIRGMSLRDWFAGQALAGLLANSAVPQDLFVMGDGTDDGGSVEHYAAQSAYEYADAMLLAREAKR